MVSVLYFLAFAASVGILVYVLGRNERIISIALMLSILVTLICLGRFLMSIATTVELATVGELLAYLGGCFCPLIVIRLLAQYSRITLPRWVHRLMVLISCSAFLMTLTIGHSEFFYISFELIQQNGFTYIQHVYGPGHKFYSFMVIFYWVVLLYLAICSVLHRKEIPNSSVAIFLAISFPISAAYFIELALNIRFSTVPFSYLLAGAILLHWMQQFDKYNLQINIAGSIEAMNEIGYIEFDSDYRCAGYNSKAMALFPELEDTCPLGKEIVRNDSVLFQKVILWMLCREDKVPGEVQLGDRFYEMHVRNIPYHNNPCVGYMLELVDRTAEKKLLSSVASYNRQLKKDVALATKHVSHMKDMMVVAMASMVESRDNSTGGHIKRTYQVMKTFSEHLLPYRKELGMSTEFLEMVTRAAPMHDLGKIAIDDAVLKKQGRFTAADYEIMKKHPEEGAKIVRHILTGVEEERFVQIAENVAHYHHERWDGLGYPSKLKGEEIPLEARLMAFPDVCDALLSKRCYKDAFTYDEVFSIIEKNLGSQFDPKLGKYFIECRPEIERMYEIWYQEDRDAKMLELQPVSRYLLH